MEDTESFKDRLGTHTYEFVFLELKKHTYRHPDLSSASAFYYQGLLKETDRPDVEVSLLCFEAHQQQLKIAADIFTSSTKIADARVLKSYFYGWNEAIKKNVICFERFESFFGEKDRVNSDFLRLERQDSTGMLMYPDSRVQLEIVGLTNAINKMHLANVSNSLLDMTYSYVWCKGKLKTFPTYSRGEISNSEWISRVRKDLEGFKNFLDKDLLVPRDYEWEKKIWFLKCFDSINRLYPIRGNLNLITLHPFLMTNKKTYLENFSRIRHAVTSGEYGALDLTSLKVALDGKLIDGFINNNTQKWTRPDMHSVFLKMIRESEKSRQGRDKNLKNDDGYKTHRAYGLLNLLRDIYQHGREEGITLDEFFNEVDRHWPLFNGQLHEYIYIESSHPPGRLFKKKGPAS